MHQNYTPDWKLPQDFSCSLGKILTKDTLIHIFYILISSNAVLCTIELQICAELQIFLPYDWQIE